jgi:Ni,Fe-hydrogenase III small subunit
MRTLIFKSIFQSPATGAAPQPSPDALRELAQNVDKKARDLLGRSLTMRVVDAGSCNGCELEIHAIENPLYDVGRFGIRFAASPRHADVLLVTGPVTTNMRTALLRTYAAMPSPKWVIAAGDCACDGCVFADSYATIGRVSDVLDVDLHIPGCPPEPQVLLQALLALLAD